MTGMIMIIGEPINAPDTNAFEFIFPNHEYEAECWEAFIEEHKFKTSYSPAIEVITNEWPEDNDPTLVVRINNIDYNCYVIYYDEPGWWNSP